MTMKEWMDDVDAQIGILMRAVTRLSAITPDMNTEEGRVCIERADDITDELRLRDLSQRIGYGYDEDDYER